MIRERRERNIVIQNMRKQVVTHDAARITSHSRVALAVGQNQAEGIYSGCFQLRSWPGLTRSAFPATALHETPVAALAAA